MIMDIKILSDLHIEFMTDDYDPGKGDVLVLCGDIMTAVDCNTGSELEERYWRFFNKCVDNYNKVFYTIGNHEHYHYLWRETEDTIREWLPEGVTLLVNQSECYQGLHFVGATLWTDFDKENQEKMGRAQRAMSDYSVIMMDRLVTENNVERIQLDPIIPQNTLNEHNNSRYWLSQCLPFLRGDVFVFTHHSPSYASAGGYNEELSFAYCSDLNDFIRQHPNVRYWAHGHIHESNNYHIGMCNVISNPRGYDNFRLNPSFDPEMSLSVEPHAITLA